MGNDVDPAGTQVIDPGGAITHPCHADVQPSCATDAIKSEANTDTAKCSTSTGSAARSSSEIRHGIVFGLVTVTVLTSVFSWMGFQRVQTHREEQQRALFLQVGRQAALNLTTISYTEVDADIRRILDSSVGEFREDFQNRSQPFVEMIKKVQSQTEGTVVEAGVEAISSDQAQILVALLVKTYEARVTDPQPRQWRMRINVQKTGDSAKVAKVEFVP